MLISATTRKRISERLRRLLGGARCRVQAAALPWRVADNGALEIMLITSRGSGRWVVPKGWPEGDEPLCEAAAREAIEEAGLSGDISPVESGRFYYGKLLRGGFEQRCEVMVYPLKVAAVAEDWKEKGQRERRWFSAAEAAKSVNERDLGEMLAAFAR